MAKEMTGGAIIVGRYKYISGYQSGMAYWTGPEHPNATLDEYPVVACLHKPCVFDIWADPTEHNDLADERPDLVTSLQARLKGYLPGFFQTTDYGDGGGLRCKNLTDVISTHHGFMAPMCETPIATTIV